jgi:hypothetical protein
MMDSLRKGLFAGLLAGLVLALLYFVDYGPGANLHTVARWFILDSKSAGSYIGFALLLILGAFFGLAFGAIQRGIEITLSRTIVSGLLLGIAWFVILVLLLGIVVMHITLGVYGFMFFIVTSLLYGLLVGYMYYQNPLSRMS